MTPGSAPGPGRWAWATVDLDAIAHNVRVLRAKAAPADVWAVVKANGYGHGAVDVARAARRAGATGLCVALVDEGRELRLAGIDGPILVFGEQPAGQITDLVRHGLTPTVYSQDHVAALAARSAGGLGVHVNVDTGMQRVGVPPERAADLLAAIRSHGAALSANGLYTHLACADDPGHPATDEQLERFDRLLAELGDRRPALIHVANSAGALVLPHAHRSLVRAGIAIYGISPGPGVDAWCRELRPALTLEARVAQVKHVAAGSHVSYGWTHRFDRDTSVATVPIGYADGVPRRLGTLPDRPGAALLIRGRRHPIVGVVTMDQLMVDVGDEAGRTDVTIGDPVVLIGAQGAERIRAEDWAARLGTIGYEIVCGIGARVPRVVVGSAGR